VVLEEVGGLVLEALFLLAELVKRELTEVLEEVDLVAEQEERVFTVAMAVLVVLEVALAQTLQVDLHMYGEVGHQ